MHNYTTNYGTRIEPVGAAGPVVCVTPVPLIDALLGLDGELLTIFTVAGFGPTVVGAKVIDMVQVPFIAIGDPLTQVSISLKSVASETVIAPTENVRFALPVFVSGMV